jgi:molybdopterin-guanine dinucleotide biosynthesis protein A
MMVSYLSAMVLAGGLSSRMGQDKALIPIASIPLLQRTCQIAATCADQVYVVTPWVDRYQTLVGNRTHLIPEVALPNGGLHQGPLVGFAQGLAYVTTDWVLLLACDLPRLNAAVLQTWTMTLPEIESTVAVVLPRHPQGWWEPLCGFYRRQCLPALQQFVQAGGRSFQKWLTTQSVQPLALAEPEMLLNCNTPADLQGFLELP